MTLPSVTAEVPAGGVIPHAGSDGSQGDRQHLRIDGDAGAREGVDEREDEDAGEQGVEEIEGRRGEQQGEEEDAALDAAEGERPEHGLVDAMAVLVEDARGHGGFSCRSEQPGEELRGEQCEAAAKDDAADLALGAALAEHEHQAAEDDGDEGERAGEGPGEGGLEVLGGAFPGRLRRGGERPADEDGGDGDGERGEGERVRVVRETLRHSSSWGPAGVCAGATGGEVRSYGAECRGGGGQCGKGDSGWPARVGAPTGVEDFTC